MPFRVSADWTEPAHVRERNLLPSGVLMQMLILSTDIPQTSPEQCATECLCTYDAAQRSHEMNHHAPPPTSVSQTEISVTTWMGPT